MLFSSQQKLSLIPSNKLLTKSDIPTVTWGQKHKKHTNTKCGSSNPVTIVHLYRNPLHLMDAESGFNSNFMIIAN